MNRCVLVAVLVAVLVVSGMSGQAAVAAGHSVSMIGVAVDGEIISLPRAVRNEGGVLYVPARSVLEAAGVVVHFDGQMTTLVREQEALSVTRGGQIAAGDRVLELSAFSDGTLFIPLRMVAEAFGFHVNWLPAKAIAHVITDSEQRRDLLAVRGGQVLEVSREDVELMARMVEAEAFGEPYEGKVAVAAVIINRVNYGSFPDTVHGVIYQSGQFATHSHLFSNQPRQIAIQAVHDALSGWDPSQGALYFFNPYRSSNTFLFSRPVTVNIGNHRFAN